MMSGITTEEILAHKIWWDKYCSLKFENNKALQKWKSAKDEEDKADKKMFIDIKKNSVILEKINDQQKKQYTQKLKLKIDQWKAEMNEKRTQDNNEKVRS